MFYQNNGGRHVTGHFYTNALNCYLCNAGYDMEDAMILNKSSVERGFAHASIYKTETIDLREERGRCVTSCYDCELSSGVWMCLFRGLFISQPAGQPTERIIFLGMQGRQVCSRA